MLSPESIREVLNGHMEGGTLTLPADAFPDLGPLFNDCLGGKPLVIKGTSVPPRGDITLTGGGDSDPFKEMTMDATFAAVDGKVTLYLTAEGTGSWKLQTSFPAFASTFFNRLQFDTRPQLILSSYKYSEKIDNGLYFSGTLLAGTLFEHITWLLGGLVKFDLFGKVQFVQGAPALVIAAPVGNPVQIGHFTIPVTFSLVSEVNPEDNGAKGKTPSPYVYAMLSSEIEYKAGENQDGDVTLPLCAKYFGYPGIIALEADLNDLVDTALDKLQALAGETTLGSILPQDFHLSDVIQLSSLVLTVNPIQQELISISISIYSDTTWNVIPGYLTIDQVNLCFNVYPSGTPKLRMLLTGEITLLDTYVFDVGAGYPDPFMEAKLGGKAIIPLNSLMEKYLPGIPAPSDLSIDEFSIYIAPGKQYSTEITMAQDPPWTFDVGITTFTVGNVFLNYEYTVEETDGKHISGSFGGAITFEQGIVITASYEIPGNFMIRGDFPEVKLSRLISTLCNVNIEFPGGFDLVFVESSLMIEKQGSDYMFMFGTQVKDFGSLAFQVCRTSSGGESKWGFAAGLDLSLGKPSGLPGLSVLSLFEDVFGLKKLLLIVSSIDDTKFKFPDLAAFNNPNITSKKITLPKQSDGVIAGLNVYAEWELNTSKQQHLLKKLLDIDMTLGITLQIGIDPSKNSRLFVTIAAEIVKIPFKCTFGGMIQGGEIGLFLTGTITVDIQGSPQTFDVTLVFVENGAFISADMKGPTAVDFGVFKLSNLAVEIGINWEGIPSLGVAGTIDVATFESSIAVFFDSDNPAKSMVAGALSKLSLKDVLDALTGNTIPSPVDAALDKVAIKGTQTFSISASLANDLDNLKLDKVAKAFHDKGGVSIPSDVSKVLLVVNTKGSIWYLTDLTAQATHYQLVKKGADINVSLEAQFYCVPMATSIGTINFDPGVHVSGAIEFFEFNASVKVIIEENKGIAVDASMTPIVIGSKKLLSITGYEGKGGPEISLATFNQPDEPKKEFQSPHFFVSGELQLLGFKREMYVNITEKGFNFDIQGDLIPGIYFDLHGEFGGLSDLDAGGSVKVGVGTIDLGILGKISIDTDVEGTVDIGYDGKDITATLEASFQVFGSKHEIAKFNLDIDTQPLINLVDILFDKVKDILEEILENGVKWAEYVAKGFIEGVEDVAKVLADVFNLIEDGIWGDHGKEVTVIRELLTKSQASTLDVTPGSPPPSQEVIDEITAWAKNMQESEILEYVEIARMALPPGSGVEKFNMSYVGSFENTYEESQVVEWIFNSSGDLSPLADFNKYYTKSKIGKQFTVSVKADADFENVVDDLTVTVTYPGLSPDSFRFTSASRPHIFTANWNAEQKSNYTIQYRATFKDGTPPFSSQPVSREDTNVTVQPGEIGIQHVLFDASGIDFGTGDDQIDSIAITVDFHGDSGPSKKLLLTAANKTEAAKSTYNKPVSNIYTYTAVYSRQGQTVYTSPATDGGKPVQVILNPLREGNVEFIGTGFDDPGNEIKMIAIQVQEKSYFLKPESPRIKIPYVFTPGPNLITYKGSIAKSTGSVPIPETTVPYTTIEVGNAPSWFSVRVQWELIRWDNISLIEVTLGKEKDVQKKNIVPGSLTCYWGFSYEKGQATDYTWSAIYYYKDGTKKSIPRTTSGNTILELPAVPGESV